MPVNQVNKNYLYAKRVNYIGTKNLVDLILKSKQNHHGFFLHLHLMFIKPQKI